MSPARDPLEMAAEEYAKDMIQLRGNPHWHDLRDCYLAGARHRDAEVDDLRRERDGWRSAHETSEGVLAGDGGDGTYIGFGHYESVCKERDAALERVGKLRKGLEKLRDGPGNRMSNWPGTWTNEFSGKLLADDELAGREGA